MSYVEWLYAELVEEGFIDEDSYSPDELTKTVLLTETEIEEADLDNYENEFVAHCRTYGETPIMDLED